MLNLRLVPILLTLLLVGCGAPLSPLPPVGTAQTAIRASLQGRLDRLLEECLTAARSAPTPAEAERAALGVYERWKATASGESQFQVQSQRLSGGGFQVQLQLQLTEGEESLQAQKQIVVMGAHRP